MATCNNQIKPVRTYQDTVFRKLFSTKEKLIELYNALEGESFGPETKVELTTLEDVLYIDRKNDLSFLIEDRFVILIEHQSTINPNLPLRDLIYIARTLEKMMESLPIYGETLQKIPTPEFYVLYTGEEKWEQKTLRLSESFNCRAPENSVELVVKVINLGYNEKNEVLKRSETLAGYSRLLHYIKEGKGQGKNLQESIDDAVKRCMKEGVLRDFLKKNSQEVGNMLFDEVSWEEVIAYRAEEARKKGRDEGYGEAVDQGIRILIESHREENIPKERTIDTLIKKYGISSEQAAAYYEKETEPVQQAPRT